jgi:hypothetical protein
VHLPCKWCLSGLPALGPHHSADRVEVRAMTVHFLPSTPKTRDEQLCFAAFRLTDLDRQAAIADRVVTREEIFRLADEVGPDIVEIALRVRAAMELREATAIAALRNGGRR